MKKLLICGASGFIGRNLLNHFRKSGEYQLYATVHRTPLSGFPSETAGVEFVKADLTQEAEVSRAVRGMDIVIQAAAATSGAKEIVSKPYLHVTDNAVMNSLLLRACYENRVGHFIFFSCTVMYPPQKKSPLKETDFNDEMAEEYFGAGWTKVYAEKICEFYSRIGKTRHTVIRHSNIYGPYDKVDLERSHVFGATLAKVMAAPAGGKIKVWGSGREKRDFLYVEDLMAFVDQALRLQKSKFDLVNVASGESISVAELARAIIRLSGKRLTVEFDPSKPNLPYSFQFNIDRAKRRYRWSPRTSLEKGIVQTLDWYRNSYFPPS